MSSDSEVNFPDSSSLTALQLDEPQIRRLSLLLPLILGLAPPRQATGSDAGSHRGRVRVIIVDPTAGAMIVIEGSGDLQSMFQGLPVKPGVLPASKDSIQAMPRVVVTEEGADCSICLEAYEVGGEAREMPCKHRFHSGCIEKWLGIHGSCPICRFLMPAEEENKTAAGSDGEQEDGGERRESGEGSISVSVWVRSLDDDDDPMEVDTDPGRGAGESNSDSREGNSNSAADDDSSMNQEPQDMEF